MERLYRQYVSQPNQEARYQKHRKLGAGTYAVVYEATDTETKQKIALKKIKLGSFEHGIDISAIREVKFLREIKHPHIITVLILFFFCFYLCRCFDSA